MEFKSIAEKIIELKNADLTWGYIVCRIKKLALPEDFKKRKKDIGFWK